MTTELARAPISLDARPPPPIHPARALGRGAMTPLEAALVVLVAFAALFVLRRALRDRHLDLRPLTPVFAPLNAAAFALRRAIGWSRGLPRLHAEPKEHLFDYLSQAERAAAEARETDLRTRFDLAPLAAAVSRDAYRENLYVLDVLERAAPDAARGVSALTTDVGSKDFVYAPALAAFTEGGAVHGVEIDGHVVYRDLYSRADHARAYARLAEPGATYHVRDFAEFRPPAPATLITMFFPFVTEFALVRWGLPRRTYRPQEIFSHAVRLLEPGGLLVVVNHSFEERDRVAELARGLEEIERVRGGDARSLLVEYMGEIEERTFTTFRRRA
jgi:hypothetical protein